MQSRALYLLPAAFLSLLGAASAQTPVAIVLDGDNVPGVGAITSIDNLAVNDAGQWLVEADTNNADTNADGVLLKSGALLLREGQPVAGFPGSTLDSFDDLTLNMHGDSSFNLFLDNTGGLANDSGVYWNAVALIPESTVSTAPQLSPGTPYIGYFGTKINAANHVLIMASVDDPAIATTVDRAIVVVAVSPTGSLVAETVIAKEGDLLPGAPGLVTDFATGPHSFTFNDAGDVMFFADTDAATTIDGLIYVNGTILAQEGSASPVAGRNWLSLADPRVDLSNTGHHVHSGSLDGDAASNLIIVRDGQKLVQEGDALPAISPFTITGFGTAPIHVDDEGNVLWTGLWNDPDTTKNKGLFLNDTLLVQQGVTLINGLLVQTLPTVQDASAMSDDGLHVLFEATLQGPVDGAFLIAFPFVNNYCVTSPSSVGPGALISASGSNSIAANTFTLHATGAVPNVFSIFFYGDAQQSVPLGDGVLCLGGNTFRLNPPMLTDANGDASRLVDFTQPPPGGDILAGSSWNFQFWYRDPTGPLGSGFNFSDALNAVFVP